MITRQFERDDLARIEVQEKQRPLVDKYDEDILARMEYFESYSFIDDDGEPMACAGIIPIWGNRAWVWSVLSEHAGKNMLRITRALNELLSMTPFNFIEVYVMSDHEEGLRWVSLLGFDVKMLGGVKGWMNDENMYDVYVRIQK